MKTLEQTLEFIKDKHSGQFDKSGAPYWEHCYRVMERGVSYLEHTNFPDGVKVSVETLSHALLMHDLIEDTDVDDKLLLEMGYPNEVVEIVKLLSRVDSVPMTYMEFVDSIVNSGNVMAMIGKLADNDDNSDPVRIMSLPEDERSIIKRYERSKKKLRAGLENLGVQL